jgi:hypothetical protein
LESFGGQFIIAAFRSDECLKLIKIGKDESIAFIISALKFGALMASTAFLKHKSTIKVCG